MTTPIEIGGTYEFHSTAMTNPDVTPFSGQTVTVVRKNLPGVDFDEECEQTYEVRFSDGHTATAFEGEINGYYLETGQCVEAWRHNPALDAQMRRDAQQHGFTVAYD